MLNSEQKKAIEVIDKPLIVIAGPGTGKTTVITKKISYLFEKDFNEDEVLAITFTNKAAQEMSVRVETNTNKIFQAKTFHSFALEIIEEYQDKISQIDRNYKIIEEQNQLLFFLENIENFNLDSIEISNNLTQLAYDFQSAISKYKDFGYSLKNFEELDVQDSDLKIDMFTIYTKYEEYKKKNNFLDFGDLLLIIKDLFEKDTEVLEDVKKKYKYILVDEFQDTNLVQLEILKLISDKNNITIVGDQKQSIYSFRGANYENLEGFKRYFKNFEEVYLHENYRSSSHVLKQVNNLIKNISSKKEVLNSNLDFKGNVRKIKCMDENSQLVFIAQKISEILSNQKDATIGVLFRRKSEIKTVSNFLKRFDINHNSNEIRNIFNEEIVKEVLFLLQIIDNPHDSNQEFFYILNNLNLKRSTIQTITRKSSLKRLSIFDFVFLTEVYVNDLEEDDLVNDFKKKLEFLISLKKSRKNLFDIVENIIYKFNLYEILIDNDNYENVFLLNNFLKFVLNYNEIYKDNSIANFLKICYLSKRLNLSLENSFKKSNVELLTVHNSKGKEFDYVIIAYLNDRKFPVNYKGSKFEFNLSFSKDEFLDEEKRLFFVAMSRSKKNLDLLFIKKFEDNKLDSKPSEFLDFVDVLEEDFESNFDDLKVDREKELKLKILKKINKFVLENKYDLAKKEIECLNSLFNKQSNLSKFLTVDSEKIDEYKDELKNSKKSLKIDDNMVFSVSQLKMYEQCPRKYMYSYIYKIPSKPKHYFDFGTTMHSVLEKLIFDVKKDSNSNVLFSKAATMLHDLWISKGYENAIQEKEYFQKGLDSLKKYIDKEIELLGENRQNVALEKKFLLDIEGKKLMGFIDRIDKIGENYEIIDYKTSNSMMPANQLQEDMQLYVYAMAIKEIYKNYPKKMGLWYLIHNKISSIELDKEVLKKIKKNILELIKRIESKDFGANPSFFNCKYCDFNKICKFSKEN